MKKLALIITILSLLVTSLGAYVRLSNAGLGCPDWPGCYGHFVVPEESQIGSGALKYIPNSVDYPLVPHKAWKEMAHRYAAGTLATLILLQALLSLKTKKNLLLSFILLGIVLFQAALGMWTVTLKLHPVVVMLHLIGGLATLSIAWLLFLKFKAHSKICTSRDDRNLNSSIPRRTCVAIMATIGLCLLMAQIILGGWVSSNYAALACPDFPTCQGKWWPDTDFVSGFRVFAEIGHNYDGGWLTNPARVAIHLAHRIGGLINLVYTLSLCLTLVILKYSYLKKTVLLLIALIVLQISLGLSNIFLVLPLPIAVAHNTVAALLLLTYIYFVRKITTPLEMEIQS